MRLRLPESRDGDRMKYYKDIREIVGKTPLLQLNHLPLPDHVRVFAKLEYLNPGGSMKDRIGLQIIKEAEESHQLKPGGTIIEATAGNTGIGLALAALQKGYRLKIVIPEKFSIEKQRVMQALGAELIVIAPEEGIEGAMKKADELAAQIPDSFVAHQFSNPANVHAHEVTGEEIWEELDGKIDVLVAGAGSGGSLTGISRALKRHNPAIKVVLADPVGSILGGGQPGNYKVEGIGNHFMPDTFSSAMVDEVEKITDDEAYFFVRALTLYEGILGGSSSGEAVAAAIKQALRAKKPQNIVTVLPDRSDRYFSENIYHFEKALTDFSLEGELKGYLV